MKKFIVIFTLSLICTIIPLVAGAQTDTVVTMSPDLSVVMVLSPVDPVKQTSDTLKKWDFHLSMGTAFVGSRHSSASLFNISPSVVYRPNERLTVKASASLLNSYSLSPSGYALRGRQPRDMAPLRNPSGVAASVSVAASYKVNERLMIGAMLWRVDGDLASGANLNPWLGCAAPLYLDATAVTAALRYRFKDNNYLDINMTFVDDRTGALGPLYFGSPLSPIQPFSTHGWFNCYNPVFDSQW